MSRAGIRCLARTVAATLIAGGTSACLIGGAEDGNLLVDPRLIATEEQLFSLARPGSLQLIENRSLQGSPRAFTRGFSAPGGLTLAALHLRPREEALANPELVYFFPLEVVFAGASVAPGILAQQQTYEVVSGALVQGYFLGISCGKNGGAGNLLIDPTGRTGLSSQSLGDALAPLSLCSAPFFLGSDRQSGGGVVLSLASPPSLTRVALTPTTDAFSIDGTATPLDGAIPPLEPSAVRFVEREADGALLVLTESGGAWRAERGEGSEGLAVSGAAAGQDSVWRGSDGALRIATTDGLYRWAPPEAPVQLAPSPASGIDVPWEPMPWRGGTRAVVSIPNPSDPSLLIPQAVRLRVASEDGFEVIDVAPTPCTDDAECRRYGESEVLGLVGVGENRRVLYGVWSWIVSSENGGRAAYIAAPPR